jgi:hypothetical protein
MYFGFFQNFYKVFGIAQKNTKSFIAKFLLGGHFDFVRHFAFLLQFIFL